MPSLIGTASLAALLLATLGPGPRGGSSQPRLAHGAALTLQATIPCLVVAFDEDDWAYATSREIVVDLFREDPPFDNAVSREIAVGPANVDGPFGDASSREIAVGLAEPEHVLDNGASREISVRWDPDAAVFAQSRELSVGGTTTLKGRVFLKDIDPLLAPTSAMLEVRTPDRTLATIPIDLVDGRFEAPGVPRMWVGASIKVAHWLRRTVWVNTGPTATGDVVLELDNGDIDDDNAVTVFDYNALSDAFDTVEGDPGWNPMSDLDGDGAITVFDYNILSENFDKVGDD